MLSCSYRPSPILAALLLFVLGGCSTHRSDLQGAECNSRAHINIGVEDYLSTRVSSAQHVRVAFTPFDVPETFAVRGREYGHDLGHRMGIELQKQFQRTGLLDLAELQDEPSWPGRREDFDTGNYGWMRRARNAGFDAVMIGSLREMRNPQELVLSTKVIDVKNGVTVWSGDSMLTTTRPAGRDTMVALGLQSEDPPNQFHLNDRLDLLVECAAVQMLRYPREDEPSRFSRGLPERREEEYRKKPIQQ